MLIELINEIQIVRNKFIFFIKINVEQQQKLNVKFIANFRKFKSIGVTVL